MSTPSIGRRGRLLLGAGALVTVLALPGAALADTTGPAPTVYPAFSNGSTIQVIGGTVTGRLIANVHVTFTCDPFLVYDWETGTEVETTQGFVEFSRVVVLQVSGRTINFGEAEFSEGDVVCDGTTLITATSA